MSTPPLYRYGLDFTQLVSIKYRPNLYKFQVAVNLEIIFAPKF